jgi:cytosine/adenosine deaminase-related metal-dependent hydrolase
MRLLIEASNTSVAIEHGKIIEPSSQFDRIVRSRGELRPGLINAHDHLHRNHYGRLGAPPYANARDWAADIQIRYAAEIARGRNVPRRVALLTGAWKNLLAGVTHVVHHDPWERDFDADFPVNVVRIANADSVAMLPDRFFPAGALAALHVAEGVDEAAADEVRTLDTQGLLNKQLITVHLVGVDADGLTKLRACGCAMVWCPTSNDFLFGRTAPAGLLESVDVLLGSDSLLTGAGTLLDDMRAARGIIPDSRLLDAIGALAARRLVIEAPSLAPGSPADFVLFRGTMLGATTADVLVVMAHGELRVLAPELVPLLGVQGGQTITWRGVTRWISEDAAVLLS